MDFSKIIFIFGSVICFFIIPALVRNARRYYLSVASFMYVFSTGWIFYHYTGLMLADIPIFCLFFLGIFTGDKFDWKASPIGLAILGMIVWGIVSSFSATEQGWALAEVTKHLRAFLLIVLMLQNIKNLSDLRLVIFSMLAGMLIESLIGIYQSYYRAMGIWFLGERPAWRVDWRASGTFFVSSFYANYLALLMTLAYRMFVFYRPPKLKQIIFFGVVFLLSVLALLKTYGRSAWIASSVALVFTSLISFFKSKYKSYSRYVIPIVVVFAAVCAIRYHQKILDQFGENRRLSYESRFVQWKIAGRMVAARPITGFGLENYQLYSPNFLTAEDRQNVQAGVYTWMVHNSYLLYAVELGIPGAFFLVLWFLSILWMCVKILRVKISHPFITNTTMGILGGIIAIMIALNYSPDIHEYSILYQLGLFSGILLAEWKILKKAEWQKICSLKSGVVHSKRDNSLG